MAKTALKEIAVGLRKRGLSIRNIAGKLQISRSTASYWCRDIKLSPTQINQLTFKQKKASINALLHAAENKREARLLKTKNLEEEGRKGVGAIYKRDILIAGLALYWGEGYKKESSGIGFTNSDPYAINFFIKWLEEIYSIEKRDLILRVSINALHKYRFKKCFDHRHFALRII